MEIIMKIDEYSYLWDEEKNNHVLIRAKKGYAIYNKSNSLVTIIEDNVLAAAVIDKMIESGVKVCDSFSELDNK